MRLNLPVGNRPRSRRLGILVATCAVALVASACGGGGDEGGGGEDEAVQLTFAWWGSDSRHEQTQQIIDAFEAENPNITITPDFTDFSSYWDKLSTATAGGNPPDIMTQEERYLAEYATRGQLLDLRSLAELDLTNIDPLALAGGEFDGGLFAVATGVNAFTVVADPQIFEEAGVEMPDDTTWTWDDFHDIAVEISEGTPDDVFGTQPYGSNDTGFNIYARQQGESLYSAEGGLGFTAETLAEWWDRSLALTEDGATPEATAIIDTDAGGPDQSLLATNRGAMGFWWTNQLGALAGAAGRELVLLRQPGEADGTQPGMFLKPAMFYSISSQTEHPEEAAMFVDYLLNSEAAAEIMLTDRGLPANLQIREHILPMLPEDQVQVAEFLEALAPDLGAPPPPPPTGAGETFAITGRLYEEVLFGNLTTLEAAEQFMSEVETAIGG